MMNERMNRSRGGKRIRREKGHRGQKTSPIKRRLQLLLVQSASATLQPLPSAADDITPSFKDQFVTFHLFLHLILLLHRGRGQRC